MTPRAAAAVALAVVPVLLLAGCAGGAFDLADTGSLSSIPTANGGPQLVSLPLENRSGSAVELLSVAADGAANVTVGAGVVAPILRERDGTWLSLGSGSVGGEPLVEREWVLRRPIAGTTVRAGQRDVQAALPVSIRDLRRPARITGITVRYRQDGIVRTETSAVATCWFPAHRRAACSQP